MLWVILMGALSVVEAQEIRISSPFAVSKTRNEAVTRPRVDFNHDTCALVIVNLDFEEVDFEGDIKLMQYRDGEWWIYLSPGANWLTILSEYHTPLRVDFAPVRPATTYTLGLRAAVTMQTIEVVDPCQADITMVDARRFSRMDASGRTCALVRIGFVQPNVEFSGAVDKEYRRGEWWVWFPVDATTTTIDAPGYEPLTITFEPLRTAVTYVMTLKKGKEETKIVGGQKPKAEANPKRKTEPRVEPKPKQEPTPEPTPESIPEPTPESVVVQEVPPVTAPAVTVDTFEKRGKVHDRAKGGLTVKVGGAFPMGDFSKAEADYYTYAYTYTGTFSWGLLDTCTDGGAGMGFNLGVEYAIPVSIVSGLSVVLSLDGFYNGLNKGLNDFYSDYEEDMSRYGDASVTLPSYLNFPVMVGAKYELPLTNGIDLYAAAAVGANLRIITPQKLKLIFNDASGESSYTWTYEPTISLAFRLTAGVTFAEKYVFELGYYSLGAGKVNVVNEFGWVSSDHVNDYHNKSEITLGSIAPVLFTACVGIKF